MRIFFFLIAQTFIFQSCTPLLRHRILGAWEMAKVTELDQDVSQTHNPANNRWITFLRDRTFKSGGEPYGDNSGKWKIDESKKILFLDSDAGEEDDSYWHIDFIGREMTWKGKNSEFAERFTLIFNRAAP